VINALPAQAFKRPDAGLEAKKLAQSLLSGSLLARLFCFFCVVPCNM
jgi:hypothetical protein